MNLLRLIEVIILAMIIVIYGLCTHQRNFAWNTDLSLWSDVVRKSPNKARGYNEVGMYYYERRLRDKAIPFFQKSLVLRSDFGIAHNNLGLCFLGKGWIDAAIEEFKQAIKANSFDGMYHINLGIAYWNKGLNDLAYKEMQLGKDLRRRHKTRWNQ